MRQLRQMGAVIYQKEPGLFGWLLLSCLITGIAPIFGIVMPKFMLDELLGARNFNKLMGLTAILAFGTLFCMAAKAWCKKNTTVFLERFFMRMEEDMGKKPSKIPLTESEKKSVMDLYERGKFGLDSLRDWNENVQKIGGGIVTCISSGAILLANQWYLLLITLAANLFAIPCVKQMKKLEVDNAERSVPEDREFQYYCCIAYDYRYAKELKLFGGIDFMLQRAKENMDRILKINHSYFTKTGCFSGFAASVVELETAVLFGILGTLLLAEGITVGMFTMLYSASRQFGQTLNGMVTAGSRMITDILLIQPLLEYLRLPEEEETGKWNKEVKQCLKKAGKGIVDWEFRDVTFHYPTAAKECLKNCSFSIHAGETVALVGKNGAGKSTVVKLMCRFYQPQSGMILLNGVDIQRIPREAYRKILAPTFQDFQLLPFSIEENILCKKEEEMTGQEKIRVNEEAKRLGFFDWAASQPKKFSTFLSQNLTGEGVLPSGGLAQKIALARSVCHGGAMVIMDEPTAALDPRSEEEIFEQMADISNDKTCLFISHRLSSTRLADRILVMENGAIAEDGNHAELMKKGGGYRELYEAQASQYWDNETK